jgi:DNA-binding protein HU-beta
MNNKDFIAKLAEKSGYTLDDTQKMVNSVIDAMGKSFEDGNPVHISNFGTFDVKKRLERVMTNPSTGQKMLVPPKLVLNFKPSAGVKDKVKGGGEA